MEACPDTSMSKGKAFQVLPVKLQLFTKSKQSWRRVGGLVSGDNRIATIHQWKSPVRLAMTASAGGVAFAESAAEFLIASVKASQT